MSPRRTAAGSKVFSVGGNGQHRLPGPLGVAEAFAEIPVDAIARFAAVGRRRLFASGSALMRQGEESDAMFVILSGSVRVVRMHPDLREPFVLATLGPGEVVGEMGALDGARRSATVTAIDDTMVMALDAQTVARMVLENPELYGRLVRVLSKRLRSTDELAAEMRAKEHDGRAMQGNGRGLQGG